MPEITKHIAIIGGGASAVLLASRLLEGSTLIRVTLLEQTGIWATGVAYSTPYDYHLLNVRAGNMSYNEAEPTHFVNWLNASGYNYTATDFVPRKLYGVYLTHIFNQLRERFSDRISCLTEEVIALHNQSTMQFRSGNTMTADQIVLALGNFMPATPETITPEIKNTPGYFANPWDFEELNSIDPDARVLIIGSGLTMTDCVLHFEQRKHRGTIHSLCRHGYAPVSHEKISPVDDAYKNKIAALKGLDEIFAHWMQGYRAGLQPAAMADAFRPHVQQLWFHLDARDKKRFVDHLRHLWGTVRHRVPEKCFAVLQQLQDKKQLQISGGKILAVESENKSFRISYIPRKKNTATTCIADAIINCTGPSSRYEQDAPELIKQLLRNGIVKMDVSGLGLDVTAGSAIIGNDNAVNANLYALGNLTRGVFWEITAIPEIRKQAALVAERLIV